MKDALIVNLSDREVKRRLMSEIGRLRGPHEILIKPIKRTRSLNANRFYFAAVVTPFRDWLRENYGDNFMTNEQAHEMLKVKILGLDERPIEGTNETIKIIPRSKTLNTAEFDEYVEKAIAWLREFPGIEVIACEEFYERPE
jgi:hypothetical protein